MQDAASELHLAEDGLLPVWRTHTLYVADNDFVFPSMPLNGKQAVAPDMVPKKTIRAALERAGIKDKESLFQIS
jgi:hypothetical protein